MTALSTRPNPQQYQPLLDLLHDGYLITDLDLVVQAANPAAARLLQVEPDALVGHSLDTFVAEEDQPAFEALAARLLDQPGPDEVVLCFRANGRAAPPAGVRAAVIRGDSGEPVALHWLLHALTDTSHATISDHERRLQGVLGALPVGVFISDAEGRLLEINEQAKTIWGGSTPVESWAEYGQYKGWRPDGTPITPEDWAMARALRLGEHSTEEVIEIERFDGTRGTILNSAAPLYDADGRIIGAVAALQDISELARLAQESDRLRALLTSVADEVWFCNRAGQISLANTAAILTLGLDETIEPFTPLPDILSKLETFDASGQPRPPEETPLLRALQGAVIRNQEEIARHLKTGELRHRQYSAAPIRNEAGEITGAVAVVRDITEIKQIQAQEREQRILSEALRDTASALNSTLDLSEVLDRILLNIEHVVPHDAADIMLIEGGTAQIVRSRGYSLEDFPGAVSPLFEIEQTRSLKQVIDSGQPLVIPDVNEYEGWITLPPTDWIRAYTTVPIQLHEEIIGFLNLLSATPGFFTPVHADRLQTFGQQAAIAIQNARLFAQAQELAAIEERQRLARDLHDAVTQTLFSASIMAEAVARQNPNLPPKTQARLSELRDLTQGALAEMRALLLELRPTSLHEIELPELFTQLVNAAKSRKRMSMIVEVAEGIELPPEVKVALYRIAQEALNNVTKHARASEASIRLHSKGSDQVELTIADNGNGFDPRRITSTSMGLKIMRERAQTVNASLAITSQPGEGTQVIITWPARAPHSRA
ncbi:MAG: PAS domain-containing protein [Chloroflexi bacterium]|nr:PAS domain-containing protein [Chloroflexota bacterium]